MTIISLIAAVSKNNVIGNDNGLPWKLPKEIAYFKEKTIGKPVILGRKTFQTFGERPLPKRPHIVVTRDRSYAPKNVQVAHSMEEAFELAKTVTNKEIMVIGGAEIYKQALDFCDRIYLTEIDIQAEGDVFFPAFNKELFKEASRIKEKEGGISYDFVIYEKSSL